MGLLWGSLSTSAAAQGVSGAGLPAVNIGVRSQLIGSFLPYISGSPATSQIVSQLFAPLLHLSKALMPVPEIVQKWWYADQGKRIYMQIDPRAKWSDQTPITSQDVLWSVNFLASPVYNSVLRGSQGYRVLPIVGSNQVLEGKATSVSGVHIIDSHEFYFQLRTADPAVLVADLQGIRPIPSAILSHINMADWAKSAFGQFPTVVSGAFMLGQRTSGLVTLLGNSNFIFGKPAIPELNYKVVPPVVAPGLFADGGLDLYEDVPANEVGALAHVGASLLTAPKAQYEFLGWNNQTPWGSSVNFRQAMMYAIDRQSIIKFALNGQGAIENGPIPPGSYWYDSSLDNAFPYNPQTARNLLMKAGFHIGPKNWLVMPNGAPLNLSIAYAQGDQQGKLAATQIVHDLRVIAIDARLNGPLTVSQMVTDLTNHAPQVSGYVMGWKLGVDPDPRNLWLSTAPFNIDTANWTNPKDPYVIESDSLLNEQAGISSFNASYRKKILDSWQALISERAVEDFLYAPDLIGAVSNRLQGVMWSGLTGPTDSWKWTIKSAH